MSTKDIPSGEGPSQQIKKLIDASLRLRQGIKVPDPNDPLFQEFLQMLEEQEKAENLLRQVQKGAQLKFTRALDRDSRIVTKPMFAKGLAERHNAHVVSRRFVTNILRYVTTQDPQWLDNLCALQTRAREIGMFIQSYSEAQMIKRIESYYPSPEVGVEQINPHYLIVEVVGRHPDEQKGTLHTETDNWSSDCQFHLPDPNTRCEPVIELPRDGDEILDEAFVKNVREFPFSVAAVEDIVTKEGMTGLSLASYAMHIGIDKLERTINRERPNFPIQDVAAAILSLRGLSINGQDYFLGEGIFRNLAPIGNDRSMYVFDHFRSNRVTPFKTAYVLHDRRYPISPFTIDDKEYTECEIIASWYEKICHLKRQQEVA